ncbi:hypothetical protein Tco_0839351 [Tanacetum coccineum]|uniref:Uncharacterized protein n=1 Tax=Tanacetum coccineum TaxID=301880 RepID=A0ABQ5AUV9_9ASTR
MPHLIPIMPPMQTNKPHSPFIIPVSTYLIPVSIMLKVTYGNRIAVKLPPTDVIPDSVSKAHIAYGIAQELRRGHSVTNCHTSDAVNIFDERRLIASNNGKKVAVHVATLHPSKKPDAKSTGSKSIQKSLLLMVHAHASPATGTSRQMVVFRLITRINIEAVDNYLMLSFNIQEFKLLFC